MRVNGTSWDRVMSIQGGVGPFDPAEPRTRPREPELAEGRYYVVWLDAPGGCHVACRAGWCLWQGHCTGREIEFRAKDARTFVKGQKLKGRKVEARLYPSF